MVVGNGDVVRASSLERTDSLYGAASSLGTLGVTTLLEVQLIGAKMHVALTYHPVSSISEAQTKIEKATHHSSTD